MFAFTAFVLYLGYFAAVIPVTLPATSEPVHMMSVSADSTGSALKLPPGYHKQVYVYIGEEAVLTTLDTGSFRNAVDRKFLESLEAQDLRDADGAALVSKRQPCEATTISGIVGAVGGSYNELVGLTVTFRDPDGRAATVRLLCVVLEDMGGTLLIGCPTLDKIGFATAVGGVELRAYDLAIPTVMPASPVEEGPSSSSRL